MFLQNVDFYSGLIYKVLDQFVQSSNERTVTVTFTVLLRAIGYRISDRLLSGVVRHSTHGRLASALVRCRRRRRRRRRRRSSRLSIDFRFCDMIERDCSIRRRSKIHF